MFIPFTARPDLGGGFAIDNLMTAVDGLESRIETLHRLWLLMAEELRSHFGDAGLSISIRRILVADDQQAREEFTHQFDALLNGNELSKAARLIRDWAGVTWDQAHDLAKYLHRISKERKQAWLRLVQIQKALDEIPNRPTEALTPTSN